MTYFSHIRAGLISTALLLTTALASPALAETLPEISPRQIASDVEVKFNPETGAKEYIAPSFDPFEEDRTMAGRPSIIIPQVMIPMIRAGLMMLFICQENMPLSCAGITVFSSVMKKFKMWSITMKIIIVRHYM